MNLCPPERKEELPAEPSAEDAMRAVLRHYQAGRLREAAAVCRAIVEDSPENADALHLLGAISGQMGHADEGVELISRAIRIKPAAGYYDSLGRLLKGRGEIDRAIAVYRQAVKLKADFAEAHNNLGVALRAAGQLEAANDSFRDAIRFKSGFAEAHNNLGNGLIAAGKFEEASAECRRAASLKPGYAEALNNLGIALREIGLLDESAAALREALRSRPDYAEAHNNLGNTLRSLGLSGEAVCAYRNAVELNPAYAEAHNNLGVALWEAGQNAEAIVECQRAITLKPALAEAHSSLGNVLRDSGDLDGAAEHYRQALEINPLFAEAHANLAVVLKDQGRLDEAVASSRRAIEIRPNHAAHSNLIYLFHFHPEYDSDAILGEQKTWNRIHVDPLRGAIATHDNVPEINRRLRIGYVSPNFRAHVVGLNILPLLREHDHRRFEIFCYSDVARGDEVTQKCWGFSDHWRNVSGISDEQLAATVRADGIDILIDLSLHLSSNRLLAFARKPAPVQASFAGYPGNTGLASMDYRLTDVMLDPLFHPACGKKGDITDKISVMSPFSPYSSERPVRLASFWCYDEAAMTLGCEAPAEVGPPPAESVGHITFGCLNNFCKINDRVLALWGEVLKTVHRSHLLLLSPAGSARQTLVEKLAALGIEAQRIEFADQGPRAQYLRHYRRIDIGLDTFPYNGHTTSLDSLWMGVPVVTLAGQSAVSRAGVSQLTNLGLTRLIARTAEEYVKTAADLARNPAELRELRATLRDKMRGSNLMDARGFTQDVESAYRMMWTNWCSGQVSPEMQP